jgi:hypothetical protein
MVSLMKKIITSYCLVFIFLLGTFLSSSAEIPFPYAPGGALVDVDTLDQEEDKPLTLFELVNDNLRPEPDEFYLSTIYGSSKDPRALIKRSNNIRAGELFTGTVEYKIGDKISEDYEIYDIDFKQREVIVRHIYSHEYYALKLSYGSATSKLIKKYDYIPPKKKRRHRKKEILEEYKPPS